MYKQNLKNIEDRLEEKYKKRDKKKNKRMKVDGASVKKIQKIISK